MRPSPAPRFTIIQSWQHQVSPLATVLHGPAIGAGGEARSVLQLLLQEADLLRAPEFEHPVQGVDANLQLRSCLEVECRRADAMGPIIHLSL